MFDELPETPKTDKEIQIEAMRRGAVVMVSELAKMIQQHEKKKGA